MHHPTSKPDLKQNSEASPDLDCDLNLPVLEPEDSLEPVEFDLDLNFEHAQILMEMNPNRTELPRNGLKYNIELNQSSREPSG